MSSGTSSFGNVVDYLLAESSSELAPAVLYKGESLSRAELVTAVHHAASYLREVGVRKGGLVAIIGENSPQWVVWYLAILRCGGVAMPLHFGESSRLIASALDTPRVGHVLYQAKHEHAIRDLSARQRPGVQFLSDRDFPVPKHRSMPTGGLAWPEMDAENDLAAIMMTSGSTADPKGVAVTHRNIEANTRSIISYLHLTANDRMMVVLPFCYCFGLSLLHTHLRVGGSVVLNNTFIFPDKVLDEIEATACSGFAGVPSTYRILLRKSRLKSRPLRSLQHVQQAGGRMPPFVIEELARALCPHTRIFVMYGATEATARLSYLPPSCLTEKNGSIGIPIPGVELSIRDPDGRALPAGETGEIVGQGPNITKGYYNDPKLTAQRFKHGAFHTGDLGFMDTDGFIFVEGREADFVKTYGFRVSPREVGDCISTLDKVLDVTVIGVPDIEAGEALAALVVPVDGSGLTESELRKFCVSKLPNHKVPQMFKLVPKLPRSRSGKLMKSRLSEFLSEHGQRSAATAPAHRGVIVQV